MQYYTQIRQAMVDWAAALPGPTVMETEIPTDPSPSAMAQWAILQHPAHDIWYGDGELTEQAETLLRCHPDLWAWLCANMS